MSTAPTRPALDAPHCSAPPHRCVVWRGAHLLAAFALAGVALAARADGVVVIKARRIAAYETALDGLLEGFDPAPPVFDLSGKTRLDDRLKAEILAKKPKVLVAIGSKAATAVRERFPRLPVVFSMVLSPGRRGLAEGATTGVRLEIPPAEQFRRFRQLLPKLVTVGVVYDPTRSGGLVEDARAAAKEQGLHLLGIEVHSTAEVPSAFEKILGRVDAVWLVPDTTVVTAGTFRHMVLVSLRERVPLLVFSSAFVRAGALAGVAPDYRAVGEATGRIVRAVLGGEDPAAIPIQDPPSTLLINRRSAARLEVSLEGRSIPGMVLVE